MALDPPARIEALKAVLQTDWTYLPAIVGLGDALLASGQEQEALKLWERTVRTTPCLLLIERLFAELKGPRERQRLLAVLRRVPDAGADTVHYLLARSAMEEGNIDQAAAELQQIGDREQPAVQRLWAEIYRQRGALREALRTVAQLADNDPNRRDGFACRLCGRVPLPRGAAVPGCKYWNEIRAASNG
jgi:tetratricopeptide (TPR) repeat protein